MQLNTSGQYVDVQHEKGVWIEYCSFSISDVDFRTEWTQIQASLISTIDEHLKIELTERYNPESSGKTKD